MYQPQDWESHCVDVAPDRDINLLSRSMFIHGGMMVVFEHPQKQI